MEGCRYLFLSEIQELSQNGLRLVVSEGMSVGEEEPVQVGGTSILGGTLIEVTDESNTFELIWNEYVVYSVLTESYANGEDEEGYDGNRGCKFNCVSGHRKVGTKERRWPLTSRS